MTQKINPHLLHMNIGRDSSPTPLYAQLFEKIKDLILDGSLKPKDAVPSSRSLSELLNISRNTVNQAYKKLLEEGWIISEKGTGCFVSTVLPTYHLKKSDTFYAPASVKNKSLPQSSAIAESSTNFHIQKSMPFAIIAPDMESLPGKDWMKIVARTSKSPWLHNGYCEPGGYRPFRQAMSDYLRKSRGLDCEADQVIITSGVQEGLNLSIQALLSKGQSFALENPGFQPHYDLFEFRGIKTVPIEVEKDGLNIDSLKKQKNVAGVLVTPCHQYPMGYLMSPEKKAELIEWAAAEGKWIFEDDYDNELRYDEMPVLSLASIDRFESTIHLGSFTKTVYPGFNMGYMVVPKNLVKLFEGIKHLNCRHSSEVHQTILTEIIASGCYEAHVRRLKKMYSMRRIASINAISRYLSEFGEIEADKQGTHIAFSFKIPIDDVNLSKFLLHHCRIESRPLSSCFRGKKKNNGLILGYAHFSENQIEESYKKLLKGLKEYLSKNKCG